MRELTTNEIDQVSGGSDLALIIGGIGVIGVGIALISTAGLASVPVSLFRSCDFGRGYRCGFRNGYRLDWWRYCWYRRSRSNRYWREFR
jgi:hypothetical protein